MENERRKIEGPRPAKTLLKPGLLGAVLGAAGVVALIFPALRLPALGFLLGFGYGLGFRYLAGKGGGAGARWLLLAKLPVLLVLLAGLGRLGPAALLGFPLGFFGQLLDFIIQLRRAR